MSKQVIIVSFLLTFIAMFFFFQQGPSVKDEKKLIEVIQNGGLLVDVRTPAEFAEGSAPGAVNIPLDQISQNIHRFQNTKGIIVFCRSGNRASQAKAILEQAGISNVYNGGTWNQVTELVQKAQKK